jgi:hypothetical protein
LRVHVVRVAAEHRNLNSLQGAESERMPSIRQTSKKGQFAKEPCESRLVRLQAVRRLAARSDFYLPFALDERLAKIISRSLQ